MRAGTIVLAVLHLQARGLGRRGFLLGGLAAFGFASLAGLAAGLASAEAASRRRLRALVVLGVLALRVLALSLWP
jgi:hypothetical protein